MSTPEVVETAPTLVRAFEDERGGRWQAGMREREGLDYKGRFYFVARSEDGREVALEDLRWNSEDAAKRTLESMSGVELRRRLRSARPRQVRT